MRKIVVANWKLNPEKLHKAEKLISGIAQKFKKKQAEVVICPPFPYMMAVSRNKKFILGAQNISVETSGAFTGEVSAPMIKSLGASYVIVGHSERRAMGESSDIVAKKTIVALKNKLNPIICIGEKLRDNSAEHWQEIKWQLVDSLQGVAKDQISKCIIAYEPLWAISKKNYVPMKVEDISESAIFVKKILAEMYGPKIAQKVRIIYGGSVNPSNARDILSVDSVSGYLVGKASLTIKDFVEILNTVE